MDKKYTTYDFVIVGGGLVGSLTSILLARSGFRCCLVEQNLFAQDKKPTTFNPLSLNYRTILILEKYGLWNTSLIKSYPIKNLNIKCFNSLNKLRFSSKDLNLQYLGYVVDKTSLHEYFINLAKKQKRLEIFDASLVRDLKKILEKNKYSITIAESRFKKLKNIESDFVILSDGQPSPLRDQLKFKTTHKDYNQTSFMVDCVAQFNKNLAVQLFSKDGIFALIPYSPEKTSLILTLNKNKESNFFDVQGKINKTEIEKVFAGYITNISDEKVINRYDMKTIKAEEIIKDKIMLLGNSSQMIHPVGAQGFNLGVRNIETLINVCSRNKETEQRVSCCADDMYNVADKILADREKTFEITDIATKIFANSKTTSRIASSFLINLVKILPKTKVSFLKKILGLEDCSYLTIKS